MAVNLYSLGFSLPSQAPNNPFEVNWDELLKNPDDNKVLCSYPPLQVPGSPCELNWNDLFQHPDYCKVLCGQEIKDAPPQMPQNPPQLNRDDHLQDPEKDKVLEGRAPYSLCELNRDDLLQNPDEDKALCGKVRNCPSELNWDALLQNLDEDMKRRKNRSIVLCEKRRRQKMKDLYSTLRSLLPCSTNRNVKVAKYCLIEEAVKHINEMQKKVESLQTKKNQLVSDAKPNSTLQLNREAVISLGVDIYSSHEVIIRIAASRMPRCLSMIYEEVEARYLDIQSVDVYKGHSFVFVNFHAKVNCTVDSSLQFVQQNPSLQASLQSVY